MTAYLWLAIAGLLMFCGGALGHLLSTQIEKTVTKSRCIIMYVGTNGTQRIEDLDADFWETHAIVEKEKP